jgi:hypothetical protein
LRTLPKTLMLYRYAWAQPKLNRWAASQPLTFAPGRQYQRILERAYIAEGIGGDIAR